MKNALAYFFVYYSKPYVAKNVDPLIFRQPNDPDRVKHNLGDLGHFTAIVTAKTNKIGCGIVKDPKLDYKVIYRDILVLLTTFWYFRYY